MIIAIDWPATITAFGALVTAVGAVFIAYWAYRGKERAAEAAEKAAAAAAKAESLESKLVELNGQVFTLGENIDGRLSQLLAVSAAAARAEGIAAGEQAQRDRSSGERMP